MTATTAVIIPFPPRVAPLMARADAAAVAHEIIGLTMSEAADYITPAQRQDGAFVEELFRRVMLCIGCHKFWWTRASDLCGICEGKRE